MRRLFSRRAGVLVVAVVALGVAMTSAAQAQGAITVPMSVTENREPGLAGSATITPMANNQVRVDIRITGFPPNDTARPAHIHTAAGARCDTGAPVTYPLTDVRVDASGVGTSTTTVTLTPDKPVTANNAYVNVHNPAQGGRGVICGNITTTLAGAGGGAQPGAQRPAGTVAQPSAQRPAAAAPAAPRPAAAALPRTGTGLQADNAMSWMALAAATAILLLGGAGVAAVARRR